MKVAWVIILSLIAMVGAVGCVQTDTSVVSNFDRLGGLVFVDPDSVSVVLNGIQRDDLRDAASRSKYDLLRTIVDDRLGNVHRSTDDILSARDYFIRSDASDSLLAVAHLYTGRVYEDLGESEKALESYLIAQSHSLNTTGVHQLKGRIAYNIGYLYHNDYDYAHANPFLEQAIDHFNAEGDILNAAHSYNLLGANHIASGKVEEGLAALNKAGEMYESLRDKSGMMSNALTIAGLYLRQLEDVSGADSVLVRAYNEYNNGAIPQSHLLMKSQIEAEKGNYEEAAELLQSYWDLAPELSLEKRATLYNLMAYYDSRMGQYSSAYSRLSEFIDVMDSLYQDKIVTVLQEVEKKYEKQTLADEYTAYRKVVFYRILVGIICFLVVISVLLVIVRRRRQRSLDLQADIEVLKSQMDEFDDLKKKLSESFDEKNENESKLQQVLTNRILHFQQIIDYLNNYESLPGEFHKKASTIRKDHYFGELHEVTNAKYAGIVDYLKREYPTLTEDELNLCCLVCFEVNNKHMALLFGYTNHNSIFIKRHRLRKKLGLSPNHDLEAHVSNLISNLQADAPDCTPADAD